MEKRYSGREEYLAYIQEKTVAILGYTLEGKQEAEDLRNQGIRVIIGLRPIEEDMTGLAQRDGFQVFNLVDAVAHADIVQVW